MAQMSSLPKVILFCQEDRRSGKSLLAANTARILSESYRVLVIDFTWNGNLTEHFGFQISSKQAAEFINPKPRKVRLLVEAPTFSDCLTKKIQISETLLRPSKLKNLWLSPSDGRCWLTEIRNQCQNLFVFQKILAEVERQFDYIIIDFVSESTILFGFLGMIVTDVFVPVNLSPNHGYLLGHGFMDSNIELLHDLQNYRKNPPAVRFILNRVNSQSNCKYWRRELDSTGIGKACETGIRDYRYCSPRYSGLNRFHRGTTFMEDVSTLLSECEILKKHNSN